MKLKTVNIKGKEYVEVNERIKYFRSHEAFKGFSLESDLIELTDESCLIKAIIKDPEGRVIATGYAQENKSSSYINKTSFIENCETSAWGRALGNLGIGIDTSIASYDEVFTAISTTAKTSPKQAPKQPQNDSKEWLNIGTDKYKAAVKYLAENEDKSPADIRRKYKVANAVEVSLVNDVIQERAKNFKG